jgi:ABC-type antimicrobial peptide transport system permease subunit
MSFAIRTTGDPELLAAPVRGAVRRIDPNVPLIDLKTQTAQIAEALLQERAMARLSTFFGLMALALSCIGLYGLMSFIGAGRTRETGVRIALGARGRDVAADVLRRSMLLVTIGVIGGLAAALLLTRYVRSMVFGVEPNDPLTITIAIAAMVVVALAATWIPARRASRVDPVVALRAE